MAGRSRKRGRRARRAPARAPRPQPQPQPPSPPANRNAIAREALTPLAPGERPWPIRVAALLAVLVGGGDLIDVAVGGRFGFGSEHAGAGGVALFSVIMLICAIGMWRLRYWAVLGFQAILGIVILLFSILLIRASNLLGFAVAVLVIGGGGFLFYKLVRVLGRIQMPRPPGQ